VEEKTVKAGAEVQLGFAFLVDTETAQAASPLSHIPQPRGTRTGARPRGLADVLTVAQAALLEAQLSDLSAQLLPLFEFCEAALTRALDVMPTRADGPLSAEEYRSLRGIGQAQWLLAEEHDNRQERPVSSRTRKPKMAKSAD
jgi:hypothetical protein